jgi:hypothetical protein
MMTQNSIPALKALASLQQAASSGQQAVSTGSAIKVSHAKESVSFTVLSANTNQIVLQDNANKQRFSLPTSALSADLMPKGGDTLVLINANDAKLSFRLIPAAVAAPSAEGQAVKLPITYNRPLIDSWPGINPSVVSKVPLSVSAQTSVELNDPSLTQLAKILSQNAVKLGQPSIELPVLGKVTALQQVSPLNTIALVKLPPLGTGNKPVAITLPLPKSLQAMVKIGSNIEIVLSPNQKDAAIQSVKVPNGAVFSTAELRAVNTANPQLNQKIQQISASILFTSAVQSSSQKSAVPQNYVQALNSNVLNILPKNFSAQIKQSLPAEQLNDARLVVSIEKAHSPRVEGAKALSQVVLTVVAKPQMIQIATQSISSESVSRIVGSALETPSISAQSKQNVNELATTGSKSEATDAIRLNSKEPADMTQTTKRALFEQLTQRLPANELAALSPKLQMALNHTLSHSEPSAPVMRNVVATLETIINSASKETRALLQPLQLQLRTILGGTATEVTKLPMEQSLIKPSSALEKTGLLTPEIPDILRATMSAQAVTQITQSTQTASQNSFVEGLVSLLKLSLAAKLSAAPQANNPAKTADLAPNIAAFVGNIIKQNPTKPERINPTRVLQDISMSDPRGSLISEIGKLLNSHNTQKLRSAEASLQGQDTFYYSLPNIFSPEGDDIEIVIKREKDRPTQQQEAAVGATWKLDMKLDAGNHGTVLAKTTFNMRAENQGIDLHLYASSEALKSRVLKYLPMLHKRLEALGITINSQKCDVGKVDTSLFKTQLNVMHTYA